MIFNHQSSTNYLKRSQSPYEDMNEVYESSDYQLWPPRSLTSRRQASTRAVSTRQAV